MIQKQVLEGSNYYHKDFHHYHLVDSKHSSIDHSPHHLERHPALGQLYNMSPPHQKSLKKLSAREVVHRMSSRIVEKLRHN